MGKRILYVVMDEKGNAGVFLCESSKKSVFSVTCELEVPNVVIPPDCLSSLFERRCPSFEFANGTFYFKCVIRQGEGYCEDDDINFSCSMMQLESETLKNEILYNAILFDTDGKKEKENSGSARFEDDEEEILDSYFPPVADGKLGTLTLTIQLFYNKSTNEDACVYQLELPAIDKGFNIITDQIGNFGVSLSEASKKSVSSVVYSLKVPIECPKIAGTSFEKRSPPFEFANGTFYFKCIFKNFCGGFDCYMVQLKSEMPKRKIFYNVILYGTDGKNKAENIGTTHFKEDESKIMDLHVLSSSVRKLGTLTLSIQLFYNESTNEEAFAELPTIDTAFFTFLMSICKYFEKEGLCVLWFLKPHLLIFDAKYIKIFSNDQSTVDRPGLYSIISDAIGESILTMSGSEWVKIRKTINPAFSFKELRMTMAALNEGATRIVKSVAQDSSISSSNVLPALKLGVLKIFCETVLGVTMNNKLDEQALNKYIEISSRLAENSVHRFTHPWLWSKHFLFLFKEGREIQKQYKELQQFAGKIAKRMVDSGSAGAFANDGKEKESTILQRIFIENLAHDPSFTMRDVENAVNTLLFAGHDTSSYAILYCLFMLGHHSEVQEKAFTEVQTVTCNTDGYVSYSDLNKLKYLESVIKETLRIYSVVPGFMRKTSKDMTCGEYVVPKHTALGFVLYILHRNPDVFPNPEKFDPERFIGKSQKNPWAYIPFAEGSRSCIGKNFAMMEIKVILAHILRNFKIKSLDKREDIFFNWKIVMTPLTPLRLQFIKRESPFSSHERQAVFA